MILYSPLPIDSLIYVNILFDLPIFMSRTSLRSRYLVLFRLIPFPGKLITMLSHVNERIGKPSSKRFFVYRAVLHV